jgi:uncharacterized protein (UPF0303 family)
MTDTIASLEQLESELVFETFDQDTSLRVGLAAIDAIRAEGTPMAVQIVLGTHIVFKAAIGGVSDDTDAWLVGKAAAAELFESSSLRVRMRKDADASFLDGIDQDVYRTHGGSIPIRVAGKGIVGTITVSGAPDIVDHAMAVSALEGGMQQP